MQRANCWEVVGCGRERGGANAARLGVCAAAIDVSAHGINGGINGGRICWAIVGTDSPAGQRNYLRHNVSKVCASCTFYQQVIDEEGLQNVQLSLPRHVSG